MTRGMGALLGLVCALAVLACSRSHSETRVTGEASDGLVFVRFERGVKDLARARLRDGAAAPLHPTPDREEDWPYWSQAAGKLLVQVKPAGRETLSELVLWDPATNAERPLAPAPDRDEQWPMWSPNGREVVFAFLGRSPASGIGVVDVATGVVRLAAAAGLRDWFFRPHFAPDGVHIVAQRRWADASGSSLWLLQADHPPRPLRGDRPNFYQKPWFTRDGGEIVYTARPVAGGLRKIYAIDAEGRGEPRLVMNLPGADNHSAMPSPARDEIAFVSNRDGSMDVFLADLSGGEPRNLTHTRDIDEYAPHWSPDGEKLVVTAEPARPRPPGAGDDIDLAKAKIIVLDREGKRLFETSGFMPDWMPPWP